MRRVIVIGGGVIGLCSAWWLAEAGLAVSVVEREDGVGRGASYRNGGQLSYRFVAPLADAGVPLKALRWMFERDSPLHWQPRADLQQWQWLARFLLHCRRSSNAKTSARLLRLGQLSREALADLGLPAEQFALRDPGKLVFYRSGRALDAAAARPENQGASVLSGAGCANQEPALSAVAASLAGGIFTPGEAVADCHAFCLALEQRLASHPRYLGRIQADVHRLVVERGAVKHIDSSAGALRANAYVLAAGIDSRALAASAGLKLPLYPVKGYSLSCPIRPRDQAPSISVTDAERKVLYARIGDQMRVAALADLVGFDAGIDPARVATVLRHARATMPHAADYERAQPWAGLRPATPDGAPIIGASPYPNLWLNVGHGALGFTLACGSAQLLAALMRGHAPAIALDGLGLR
ncbi:MAG: D-amino acid dehydrogenase [Pseudomonadota bacterium]